MNDEQPSVQATVDPASAKLGDLITLDVRVTHPPALIVEPPDLPKTLGTFEVHSSTRLGAENQDAFTVDRFQARLQNFTTGQQELPALDIPFRDPMGQVYAVKTPTLSVTIEEFPPGPKDTGDIRGIKGVIGPTAWSPWWWVVLAAVAAAVCWGLWHKRKRILEGPPPPPPVPPDEDALAKLRQLAAAGWLEAGRLKEFYSAVSEILRAYLERAFETPALERTTSELMRDLRRRADIPGDRQAELRELLDACDLVKFAKFRPDADEARRAHAAATRFVEQTRAALRQKEENPNDAKRRR